MAVVRENLSRGCVCGCKVKATSKKQSGRGKVNGGSQDRHHHDDHLQYRHCVLFLT